MQSACLQATHCTLASSLYVTPTESSPVESIRGLARRSAAKLRQFERFEILAAVMMKIRVSCDVTPCGLVNNYLQVELYLQDGGTALIRDNCSYIVVHPV